MTSFGRWRHQGEADPGFRRCQSVCDATDDVLVHATRTQSGDVLDLDDHARAIVDLFSGYQPSNDLFMECANLVGSNEIWDLKGDRPSEPTTAMIGGK